MRNRESLEQYINGVLENDRVMLGKAITLIESTQSRDQELAFQMMDKLMPHTGNARRIGITGIPGVGKSTFIESFGLDLINRHNKRVAVLAVDPTSKKTKGSILGDKTRMEKLATHKKSFIRPSPSGNTLGGVAAGTREVMLLCEAAGYDVVIIETVGVGQSETAVKDLVDFFLLLMLAGAGDELQGIKKGILEMADLVAINKADGDNVANAERARKQLEMVFQMLHHDEETWLPHVIACSSLENNQIESVWEVVQEYESIVTSDNRLNEIRKSQNVKWMHEYLRTRITTEFYQNSGVIKQIKRFEDRVSRETLSPLQAGRQLIQLHEIKKSDQQ